MSDESATLKATFPAIQSAIKVYGDASGMRVQLEIPESEMAEAVKLLAWRAQVFKVTVEPLNDERGTTTRRRATKRRE